MALRSFSRLRQLSRGIECLRHLSIVPYRFVCVPLPSKRPFSSFVDEEAEKKAKYEQEREEAEAKRKVRRAYAIGGCVMVMFMSAHAVLLFRRRGEYRLLNEKNPPMEWEEFKRDYLEKGLVKTVVFQPQFEVGNVYLHSPQEQVLKKTIVDMLHLSAPDKFSRPPDVRFILEASAKDAKKLFDDSILKAKIENVEFTLDEFPSYRELFFIFLTTIFTLAAVSLVK